MYHLPVVIFLPLGVVIVWNAAGSLSDFTSVFGGRVDVPILALCLEGNNGNEVSVYTIIRCNAIQCIHNAQFLITI